MPNLFKGQAGKLRLPTIYIRVIERNALGGILGMKQGALGNTFHRSLKCIELS